MPHRRSPPPPPTLEANSPPAAPTGLAATAGDAQVTLTWLAADPNHNVTGYEYNVNHNDTSTGNLSGWTPWYPVPGSDGATVTHTFSGLTNGREYRYHLRAVNANGPSVGAPNAAPWFVKAVPNAPPAAPTGLAAAAGVRSVTLSWNNPGDSSITGYEYNVNHNATGTGNLTGWSPWTPIEGSGASATSVTFNNLAGGKEYRYHLRAVNAHGPSAGAPASGPPWFVSAIVIAPPPPPAAPTNLRVERVCDHKLKVRWHRSAGATGYDLEIGSANRKHWKRLLTNWPGNSWFATNWQKDRSYRFAVRAVNDGGASEWVDSALSVAPPCAVNNLRVVTSTPGEGDLGAVGGSIAASWNAGHRANAYHLDYNGTSIVSNHANTSHSWSVDSRGSSDTVSVQSVNGGLSSPSRSAGVAWLTAGSIVGTNVTLNLAGHAGDWHVKKTAPTPAGDCSTAISATGHNLSGLAHSTAHTFTAYTDAACANAMAATTFTTGAGLTVSGITDNGATLNLAGHSGNWRYQADQGPDTTCSSEQTGTTVTLSGLTEHDTYTYTAYSDNNCDIAIARITFTTTGDALTATNITATAATLTLHNHTGDWWFQETSPATGNCTAGETDFTNNVTGLIPGTSYTYKAYSNDTCATEIASKTFTTGGVSVSNLSISSIVGCIVGVLNETKYQCANAFTTGSAANGYTLHSVIAEFFGGAGSLNNFTVALHEASSGKPSNAVSNANLSSNDVPSTTDVSTLTYTCSGTGCQLAKDTDYFVVMTTSDTSGNRYYRWRKVSSDDESKTPANNGWSIANGLREDDNWSTLATQSGVMRVSATVNPVPSLTASGISGTGATLTIAGHTGDWFYKGISGTEASSNCQDVYNSTSDTLSGLTADKLYGYTAHDHASCSSASQLATEYFSTNDFDVGNLGEGAVSGSSCLIGYQSAVGGSVQCAMAFDTGTRSGGYTLKSVTGRFRNDAGNPGNIIVKLHAADTGNSSNPAATAIANANFTGDNPDTAGLYGYACAGTGCALSKDTKYFIVMSTGDNSGVNYYNLSVTNSGDEAVHPTGTTGWSIAHAVRSKWGSNAWLNMTGAPTGLVHIAADE